ncbi:MAG TPA: hypothetical protein DER02_13120 [Gammaproteobacteria bacterium]|nr:hypothetical protein [Gammaproteobacteria bacterium]
MAAAPALARPVRLLLSSLQVATDSHPVFISAWSALEIFVNATFKSRKEIRDDMFHKFDSIPGHLPFENALALFVKFLKLPLQGNTGEVV